MVLGAMAGGISRHEVWRQNAPQRLRNVHQIRQNMARLACKLWHDSTTMQHRQACATYSVIHTMHGLVALTRHLFREDCRPMLVGCAGSQHDFSAALGTYPPAQASHGAVVADRQLFMRTLRQLHDQLGTQFRIPMVSGRELDIHLLYKQVRHEHPSERQGEVLRILTADPSNFIERLVKIHALGRGTRHEKVLRGLDGRGRVIMTCMQDRGASKQVMAAKERLSAVGAGLNAPTHP